MAAGDSREFLTTIQLGVLLCEMKQLVIIKRDGEMRFHIV
jgi:hypothetical protein